MKASPIQLHQLTFRRVSLELNAARLEAGEFDEADKRFVFDKVLISTHVGFAPIDEEGAQGRSFLLTLRVVVDNKAPEDKSHWRPSPYLIDIEAGAIIQVAVGAERLGDIEDIVVVNGTSLLWSAIREQVCNLTARMPPGLATLPTVHFQDLRKQRSDAAAVPAKAGQAPCSQAPPEARGLILRDAKRGNHFAVRVNRRIALPLPLVADVGIDTLILKLQGRWLIKFCPGCLPPVAVTRRADAKML